jgi:hypothetical protein
MIYLGPMNNDNRQSQFDGVRKRNRCYINFRSKLPWDMTFAYSTLTVTTEDRVRLQETLYDFCQCI